MVCVDEGDENGASLHGVDHLERRGLDGEDDVGVGDQLLAVRDKGDILEGRVGELECVRRARLHMHLRADLDQLGNDRWRQSNAPFVRLGFLQDSDVDIHEGSSSEPILGRDAQWDELAWDVRGHEEF
jgi:hypothetical protein